LTLHLFALTICAFAYPKFSTDKTTFYGVAQPEAKLTGGAWLVRGAKAPR